MNVDIFQLSPWLWLVAPVVIVVAYTVFGLSGFGSTVISVPILAHFLPVTYLVPLMAVLDMVCAAFIGRANREQVSKAELKRIVPFMFLGFVIGLTVLVGVPDRYLRIALGAFAVLLGIHGIFNPVLHKQISALWVVPAGLIGGALSTVFGAGGPIYATFMNGRLRDKGEIRSTVSTLISISAFEACCCTCRSWPARPCCRRSCCWACAWAAASTWDSRSCRCAAWWASSSWPRAPACCCAPSCRTAE
jgi:uncharacterized protein